eukprot:2591132-Pyramimonas_sp.AAC.1
MRVEAQEAGPDTLRIRGRLQACGARRRPPGRVGSDPLERRRARSAYSAHDVPQSVFDKRTATIRPMLPNHSEKDYQSAKHIRGIRHDMLGFTDQERYLACASKLTKKPGSRRKRSDSPRASRSSSPGSSGSVARPTGAFNARSRSSHLAGSVERPADMSRTTIVTYDDLPAAETPGIEGTSFAESDYSDEGIFGQDAASALMKILYLARCCRFDLLHPVCMLAREITKRNTTCDKRLHRLICFLKTTRTHCLHGWIGDAPDQLPIMLFTDASFADC